MRKKNKKMTKITRKRIGVFHDLIFKYFTHASIFIFIYSQWQRIIPRAFRFLSNTFVAAHPLLLRHEFFAEAFYMALDDPSAVTVG